MAQLDKIETTLDNVLRKKVPVQLPVEARNWIARNVWWLALISGICLLWSALILWQTGHAVDRFVQVHGVLIGGSVVHHLGPAYYLSLLAVGATGVMSMLAAVNLKDMRRSGWRYLFYAFLLETLSSVFLLFSNYGGGFSQFLGTLVTAAIGGYFIFQIRDYFTKADAATTNTIPPVATHPLRPDEGEETSLPGKAHKPASPHRKKKK